MAPRVHLQDTIEEMKMLNAREDIKVSSLRNIYFFKLFFFSLQVTFSSSWKIAIE